jgi:hypothetical protein
MAHMLPSDRTFAAQGICETVKRISWKPIDPLDRGLLEHIKNDICDVCHFLILKSVKHQ